MPQPRIPPHSLDAEQAVIGGLLGAPKAWPDVAEVITESDFYRQDHGLAYRAIAALAEAGRPHDIVTVPEWLRAHGLLERVGTRYLGHLAIEVPSAANIAAYAEVVRDKATLRGLIAAGTDMVDAGFATEATTTEAKLDAAEQAVGALGQTRDSRGFIDAAEACRLSVDRLEQRIARGGEITGQATGFADYDRKMAGLQDGELTVIAGRPSMGKSALATQIGYYVASTGGQTLCFSLEMPAVDITDRQLAVLSGVPLAQIRGGRMAAGDWPAYTEAMGQLAGWPFRIVDSPSIGARGIRTLARRAQRQAPVRLIVIDYLQLITVRDASRNRSEQIGEISASMKQLARELQCPIVLLSQLNRDCEKRSDKRPLMADLRDSGGIEQDADTIAFLYRDEVYSDDSPHAGVAEVIVAKQRNGPIGNIDLAWDAECVRFRDYAGPSRAERQPQKPAGQSGFAAAYADRVA